MEKRRRQNLLLILAVVILAIGALVQVYLIFTAKQAPSNAPATTSQPR